MNRPHVLSILLVLAGPFTFGCCLCRPSNPVLSPSDPEKYAVLTSTWIATAENVKSNSDFWYDLVLTYCTLIESGFEADNIFVLYGAGNDFAASAPQYKSPYCGGATTITDMPLTFLPDEEKANLCNVLCCMSTGHPAKLAGGDCKCRLCSDVGIGGFTCSDNDIPQLRDEDFLITWVKGHGSALNCQTSVTFKTGEPLSDIEMSGLVKKLAPDRRVLLFETCDSGGWPDNFDTDDATVVMSSTGLGLNDDCVETSHQAHYNDKDPDTGTTAELVHGRFTYWINVALRQLDLEGAPVDSDTNENNLVSIQEDFEVVKANVQIENNLDPAEYGGDMNPNLTSPIGIAPCIFIRLAAPGNDHDVFSKDHLEDDGTVPSDALMTTPSDSPDLWVRYGPDEEPPNQPPKKSADNYVHARIHNIGCADPGPFTVKFYWAPCDDLTARKLIGEDPVNDLPVNASTKAHTIWLPSDMPEPDGDTYCLIGELVVPTDPLTEGASVAFDNNRAMIKVDVVP